MQLSALHLGALAVVQPLLISGLLFALILAHRRGNPIHRRRAGWAVNLTAALAAFVVPACGTAVAHHLADRVPAVVAALSASSWLWCASYSDAGNARIRALPLLGIVAGIGYATAALLKAVNDTVARAPLHVFYSWQLYAAAVLGAAGLR